MRYFRFTCICLFLFQLSTTQLLAQTIRQRSTTEGLSLGLLGNYMSWSSDYFQFLDERSGTGAGVSAWVGYGLTQRYEVFAQYHYTPLNGEPIAAESFHFSNATAGLRFNFSATTHAFRPYAELGYAFQSGKANQILNGNNMRDNLLFKGGSAHIGGGVNYFVALPVAITLNGSLQVGGKAGVHINGINTGDKADLASFRIAAGVVLYLSEL